ncbi:hypothetical protein KFE25_007757 [Diacronema lutheri]|uniref:Uncharacterized protein n=1 Tax=Diacronema lutheri TaxID=2081491 RepID=A0A8J6CE28_DIALT|nr:hypothetical protein KFE25_007757 [Diacronema lutheri]
MEVYELDKQWAHVATTLTASELRAVASVSMGASVLPHGLAYRRAQREEMLRDELQRFRKILECERAVPVETRRDDRIKKLQRLYGIDPTARLGSASARSKRTTPLGSSWAVPDELEADELVEWTQQLDSGLLIASPVPYDGMAPPASPSRRLALLSPSSISPLGITALDMSHSRAPRPATAPHVAPFSGRVGVSTPAGSLPRPV